MSWMGGPIGRQVARRFARDVAEAGVSDYVQEKFKEITGYEVKTPPPQTKSQLVAAFFVPTVKGLVQQRQHEQEWAAARGYLQRDGVFPTAAKVQNPRPETQSYLNGLLQATFGQPASRKPS